MTREQKKKPCNIQIFLLKVREAELEGTTDSLFPLRTTVNIDDFVTDLVQAVFQKIEKRYYDVGWLTYQAISTKMYNCSLCMDDQVAELFSGTFSHYRSADSVVCDSREAQISTELRYPQELLNSIEVGYSLREVFHMRLNFSRDQNVGFLRTHATNSRKEIK